MKSFNSTQTQVSVQIVADQGALLKQYLDAAKAAIEKYKANPPQNEAQIEDLAKEATKCEIGKCLDPQDKLDFYNSYGIYIGNIAGGDFITKITTTNKSITYATNLLLDDFPGKLDAVKKVNSASFN